MWRLSLFLCGTGWLTDSMLNQPLSVIESAKSAGSPLDKLPQGSFGKA
jgi:hypothetical protein